MSLRRGVSWCLGLSFSSVVFGACGDDEPRFLSLDRLCPALASDLCAARNGGCCAPLDVVTCESAETARCLAAVDPFTREATLNYDAVTAASQRNASRTAFDACGAPPALATFFEGGLPLAAPCERGTQCASGACEGAPLVCVAAAPAALCGP